MTKEIYEKVWGSEEWIVNTPAYCGKFLYLKKGKRCSLHYHKNKDETFYILRGEVLMEVDGKEKVMDGGEIQHITPLMKHRFSGLEYSVIIEFSTHHEESDSYRIEGQLSGDVPNEIMEKYKNNMTETEVSLQTGNQPFVRQSRTTAQTQKMANRKLATHSTKSNDRSFA
jgi:mannose-6-phosphate isomerase-like protein (cupin superfamily)